LHAPPTQWQNKENTTHTTMNGTSVIEHVVPYNAYCIKWFIRIEQENAEALRNGQCNTMVNDDEVHASRTWNDSSNDLNPRVGVSNRTLRHNWYVLPSDYVYGETTRFPWGWSVYKCISYFYTIILHIAFIWTASYPSSSVHVPIDKRRSESHRAWASTPVSAATYRIVSQTVSQNARRPTCCFNEKRCSYRPDQTSCCSLKRCHPLYRCSSERVKVILPNG
jgi:hypothetical protein